MDSLENCILYQKQKRALSSSKRNAILLAALPDWNYNYTVQPDFYFNIISNNRSNLKYSYPANYLTPNCSQSYMLKCNWNKFIPNVNAWINAAVEIKENADKYIINTKV